MAASTSTATMMHPPKRALEVATVWVVASVGVQRRVQLDRVAGPAPDLDRAADRVADVEQSALARQLHRLDHLATGQADLRGRGHVETRLHDAVVAEGDADAGVGAEQTALADGDLLLAAAGQGAHDRRSAADVGVLSDQHPGRDPALHHRGAE